MGQILHGSAQALQAVASEPRELRRVSRLAPASFEPGRS